MGNLPLDCTTDELPSYASLSAALAHVLQKHVARSKESQEQGIVQNDAFYTNPPFGRYPTSLGKPYSTKHHRESFRHREDRSSRSHPQRHESLDRHENHRGQPRGFYRTRRPYNHSRGNCGAYYVLLDEFEENDDEDLDDTTPSYEGQDNGTTRSAFASHAEDVSPDNINHSERAHRTQRGILSRNPSQTLLLSIPPCLSQTFRISLFKGEPNWPSASHTSQATIRSI
ncbi:hypothetical protein BWQ96_10556 [Gracilariopsis chorda]|uniref:Uncharacterized protein n=1 Tax=Gracilariopsis chorda TaxID=448386 RepID=A0A2V3ICC9_9FLOR|nr:hypothetical protein BWQ96_10556 [Gracilariopsis chorda]|eukprot:PXF39743.1 hypothetical protein BWQ96_10556 [Gracilariopsis chorda]